MSNVPAAVQRQLDEAENLAKQLYTPAAPATVEEQDGAAVPSEIAGTPEPQMNEPEVKVPEIKAKPGREEDVDYWRSRANTLFGMNQQQATDLNQLKQQMADLGNELARVRASEQQRAEQKVQDNDAEVFGEDLTNAIDRRAKALAESLVNERTQQLVSHIAKLESQISGVNEQVTESAQDRFVSALSQRVPDWEQVNTDPGFLNWLGQVDPVFGLPRQAAMDRAADTFNVAQAAALFDAFKGLTGKPVTVLQRKSSEELQRQVAPSGVRSSAASQSGEQRIWSADEYQQAFDPRTARELGNDAAIKLQTEADRAAAENRVRW